MRSGCLKTFKEQFNHHALPEVVWTSDEHRRDNYQWRQYVWFKHSNGNYILKYIMARNKWYKTQLKIMDPISYKTVLQDDTVIKEYNTIEEFLEDWITEGGGLDV